MSFVVKILDIEVVSQFSPPLATSKARRTTGRLGPDFGGRPRTKPVAWPDGPELLESEKIGGVGSGSGVAEIGDFRAVLPDFLFIELLMPPEDRASPRLKLSGKSRHGLGDPKKIK
jgi:hypothetical protein